MSRIHELALEAAVANDPPKQADMLNTELGFKAPRGSMHQEKKEIEVHTPSDTELAYTETLDGEEPNEEEKRTLRRGQYSRGT